MKLGQAWGCIPPWVSRVRTRDMRQFSDLLGKTMEAANHCPEQQTRSISIAISTDILCPEKHLISNSWNRKEQPYWQLGDTRTSTLISIRCKFSKLDSTGFDIQLFKNHTHLSSLVTPAHFSVTEFRLTLLKIQICPSGKLVFYLQ